MRLLVAETGEFRWTTPSGWDQQIFGTFRAVDRSLESSDAVWVWVDGLTWLETNFAGVDLRGVLDEQSNLSLGYETDSVPIARGTLSFAACNSIYTRGSSLASIAGTYVDGGQMLAIDGQGGISLQSVSCVGNGTVELIDSNFNMYRMELVVDACDGSGTYTGLAYLGDSGPGLTGDLLEYVLSSAAGQRPVIWTGRVRK